MCTDEQIKSIVWMIHMKWLLIYKSTALSLSVLYSLKQKLLVEFSVILHWHYIYFLFACQRQMPNASKIGRFSCQLALTDESHERFKTYKPTENQSQL